MDFSLYTLLQSVLVTGGAGFVGRHLVKRLLTDCKVIVADNLASGREGNIPRHKNVIFHNEDIRNRESLSDIIKREKIDSCVHLAAKVSVRANDSETMSTNVDGTLSILNACSENGVKNFVLASSAAVYGEAKTLPVTESHPLNPISEYGISKIKAENLVSSFKKSNQIKTAICLRFFNIYGEGQNLEYAGVITKFAGRIRHGLPPIIFGDGAQTRDFVSVNDAVEATIISLNSSISGTFNIGTGHAITIKELARKMIKAAASDLQPIHEQKKMDNEITHSVADITKSSKLLKFVAKEKLDDDLPTLLQE